MLNLSDDDINFVTNFVRSDLLQKLDERCSQRSQTFSENEKKYFFGVYASDIPNFQIFRGERKLLNAAAEQVNAIRESMTFAEFVSFFTTPDDYVIPKDRTDQLSPGLFFGKKERKKKTNRNYQLLTSSLEMSNSYVSFWRK